MEAEKDCILTSCPKCMRVIWWNSLCCQGKPKPKVIHAPPEPIDKSHVDILLDDVFPNKKRKND